MREGKFLFWSFNQLDLCPTLGLLGNITQLTFSLESLSGQTPIHNYYKENKIPRNTTFKECKGPLQVELQSNAQGNKRRHKQMEKYFMLMDRKNQYHENDHIV